MMGLSSSKNASLLIASRREKTGAILGAATSDCCCISLLATCYLLLAAAAGRRVGGGCFDESPPRVPRPLFVFGGRHSAVAAVGLPRGFPALSLSLVEEKVGVFGQQRRAALGQVHGRDLPVVAREPATSPRAISFVVGSMGRSSLIAGGGCAVPGDQGPA